jgi:phosphoglycolate phosphatase
MNVLFDLDGTLTDPREGIVACLRHALRSLGHPCPPMADLVECIGPPLRDSFSRLLGTEDSGVIDEAIALYRARFSATGIFENAVYPGVPEALTELRALGMTLYVATSKPYPFARRIVEHFGLTPFFRRVHGSELSGIRADKGELIAHVLELETLSSGSTVMVGDRAHDVLGARARGVFPLAVLWGYGSRAELTAAGARVFCPQPAMLAPLLRVHAAASASGAATGSGSARRLRGRFPEDGRQPVYRHGKAPAQEDDDAGDERAPGRATRPPQVEP